MPLLAKVFLMMVVLCVILFWMILARASKKGREDEEFREIVRRIVDEHNKKL